MPNVTPVFTDGVSVISAQVLAWGNTLRGTIDLRTKFGAYLFARLGRGGANALTNGVDVLIRRVPSNDAAGAQHPTAPRFTSQTAAAVVTTVNADSAAGQAALNVANIGAIVAGDVICIQDGDAGVTRLEFTRVSKVAAGVLTMSRNLAFTHTQAQADTVRNKADVWEPVWCAGGSLWEVIFDYGDDAAGDSATVVAVAQTYDRDTVA